ncbi:MAG: hypothetical protein FWG87_06920 [Defluviitaleaceae bacterium]|nr:hypothetical protein [Defluviitaleaceae bacterium]
MKTIQKLGIHKPTGLRKQILLVAMLCCLSLLGGCSSMEQQQDANSAALAYLERKYGEPFTYHSPWGDSMSGTREFWTTCESFPDQRVLVQVENYRQSGRIFRDNYLAVKYQEQVVDFFQNLTASVLGETNIFYKVIDEGASTDLSANATFAEYLADGHAPIIVTAEVRASNFISKEHAETIMEILLESCPYFYFTLVVVDDDLFGTFDDSTISRHIALHEFVHYASMTRIAEESKIRWIDGE